MTAVSTLRPYVQANGKQLTVHGAPGRVPKRAHLVTRSPSPPSPPYHHRAASDALPSSKPKPSHSFSESQSRSVPHSSTADLVPLHLKSTRSTSFWRRHWFVILVCILAVLGISAAVAVVLRGNRSAGVYIPPSIASEISEATSVGTASLGSATSSTATTSASPTKSVPGGPKPSTARSNPP